MESLPEISRYPCLFSPIYIENSCNLGCFGGGRKNLIWIILQAFIRANTPINLSNFIIIRFYIINNYPAILSMTIPSLALKILRSETQRQFSPSVCTSP